MYVRGCCDSIRDIFRRSTHIDSDQSLSRTIGKDIPFELVSNQSTQSLEWGSVEVTRERKMGAIVKIGCISVDSPHERVQKRLEMNFGEKALVFVITNALDIHTSHFLKSVTSPTEFQDINVINTPQILGTSTSSNILSKIDKKIY